MVAAEAVAEGGTGEEAGVAAEAEAILAAVEAGGTLAVEAVSAEPTAGQSVGWVAREDFEAGPMRRALFVEGVPAA